MVSVPAALVLPVTGSKLGPEGDQRGRRSRCTFCTDKVIKHYVEIGCQWKKLHGNASKIPCLILSPIKGSWYTKVNSIEAWNKYKISFFLTIYDGLKKNNSFLNLFICLSTLR